MDKEYGDAADKEYVDNPMINDILNYYVNELKSSHVNLENDDKYYLNPKFRELQQEYDTRLFTTIGWILEKYVVGQKRLEKIYGPYDLRVERELTEKESIEANWYSSLCEKYPEKQKTPEQIRQYFKRHDVRKTGGYEKGLLEKLRDNGFDINRFDQKYNSQKIRLQYFLYCFEAENKVNLTALLFDHTAENQTTRTANGKLMYSFMNSLTVAVPYDQREELYFTFSIIAETWQSYIQYIGMLISDNHYLNNNSICITRDTIKEFLDFSNIDHVEVCTDYDCDPISAFLFKAVQSLNIGYELDIIDIQRQSKNWNLEDYFSKEVYLENHNFLNSYIKFKNVTSFVKEKRETIIKIITDNDAANSNEYRKIQTAIKYFPDYFADFTQKTSVRPGSDIPVLLIVLWIRYLAYSVEDEKINTIFYRAKTGDKSRSMISEFKNVANAHPKNQLAVIYRMNKEVLKYINSETENQCRNEIENYIDRLLYKIYQCGSTCDMTILHNYFTEQISFLSGNTEPLFNLIGIFNDVLPEGYELDRNYIAILNFLGNVKYNNDIIMDIASQLCENILNTEDTAYICNINAPYLSAATECKFCFNISRSEKKIHLSCHIKYDKDTVKVLQKYKIPVLYMDDSSSD